MAKDNCHLFKEDILKDSMQYVFLKEFEENYETFLAAAYISINRWTLVWTPMLVYFSLRRNQSLNCTVLWVWWGGGGYIRFSKLRRAVNAKRSRPGCFTVLTWSDV